MPRLPDAVLPRLAPMIAKAVFAALRIMPENAKEEQQMNSVLQAVLLRCGGGEGQAGMSMAASPEAAAEAETQPAGAPSSDEPSSLEGGKAEGPQLPSLLKQLMETFVQHLLSSRSNGAVRAVASAGLQASACRCPLACCGP